MVFVKLPDSRTLILNLNPSTTTLQSLSLHIQRNYIIPIDKQRLYLHQKLLSTSDNAVVLLSKLGISPDSTLTLHVAFYGGMLDSLSTRPPPNYVAGLGYGATGFTTRSDIGPARAAPDLPDRSAATAIGTAAGAGRRRGEGTGEDEEEEENEEKGYDENQKFEGNGAGFSAEQFADLERKLHTMSIEEWVSIPEARDPSLRNKSVAQINPKNPHEWIAAARLEEEAGKLQAAQELIKKGCERCPKNEDVWLEACRLAKESIWLEAAQLEKSHGTRESLDTPHAEEKLLAVDVPAARAILQEAYAAIPNSEEIWLAAFKLEFENHEPERARMLLAKARERGGTKRVWMKSAIVERELGNTAEERRLLYEGLKLFPSFFKLWLMLGQLEERLNNLDRAKETYELGLKHCSKCIPLWLSLALLEEKVNDLSKARAVLTMAREKNPQSPQLWLAAIRAEARHGYKKESDILMAMALQEFPTSGLLWAASIEMVPRPQQRTNIRHAYKKSGNDPHVLAALGKIFWQDRNVDKARYWFIKAVILFPDIGDVWALYYKFELQHGTNESQKDVLNRCVVAEPKHGEKWQPISKAVENSHQPTEVILKKMVVAIGKEERSAENGKN